MLVMLDVAAALPTAGWPLHAAMLRHRLERARRDPLTGLPTRDLFQAKATRILARNVASLVVLIKVAARLAGYVGPRGIAGRLGGDEFAAVLPGAYEAHTLYLLHEALTEPDDYDGAELTVGASIGAHLAAAGTVLADALAAADAAMYAAKNNGGGYHLNATTSPTVLAGALPRRWKRQGPVMAPRT